MPTGVFCADVTATAPTCENLPSLNWPHVIWPSVIRRSTQDNDNGDTGLQQQYRDALPRQSAEDEEAMWRPAAHHTPAA